METFGHTTSNSGGEESGGGGLNAGIFNIKKGQFRVQIRKEKTRSLLQQKRSKFTSCVGSSDSTTALDFESNLPQRLAIELLKQSSERNNEFVTQALIAIAQQIKRESVDNEKVSPLLQFIMDSPLLFDIARLLQLTDVQTPSKSLEVSLEILIEVTCNFDTTSISDELVTILLETQVETQLPINTTSNNLAVRQQGGCEFGEYARSGLEWIIQSGETVNMRASAVLLLSNIAADCPSATAYRIFSKAMLLPIIKENILLDNFDCEMLESIVNLLANLTRSKDNIEFQAFAEFPALLLLLFPILLREQASGNLTTALLPTLITVMKDVIESANEDEVHYFVNERYNVITRLHAFILEIDCSDAKNKDILFNIISILDTCCDFAASTTHLMVELGIFDPLAMIIRAAHSRTLLTASMNALASIFSRKTTKILDRFIFDASFNGEQKLTQEIIKFADASSGGGSSDHQLRSAAVLCLCNIVSSSNQSHLAEYFASDIIRILIEEMKEEQHPHILEILDALANLIFLGNLDHDIEQNPYTQAFLLSSGDTVLDDIQSSLTDEAYLDSQRLMNLILNGNDEQEDAKEEQTSSLPNRQMEQS